MQIFCNLHVSSIVTDKKIVASVVTERVDNGANADDYCTKPKNLNSGDYFIQNKSGIQTWTFKII